MLIEFYSMQGVVYKGISTETLKKYIALVKSYIIHKIIKPELEKAKCLGLRNDGWTVVSEHYLALNSSSMVKADKCTKVDRVSLSS